MSDNPQHPGIGDEWLLDEHLDQLGDADRRALQRALQTDGALAARHRGLQRVLEPLDTWTTPPPPSNLVDRILDRIAAATERESPAVPATGADGDFSRRRYSSFRELLAVAAVIGFVVLILIPSMSQVQAHSRRVLCAQNLETIGQAVSAYALAEGDRLPQATLLVRGRWLRAGSTQVPYASNSRNPYLLLRFAYVHNAKVFICPSRGDAVALSAPNSQAFEDFPDPRNCSYDSLNMAGIIPSASAGGRLPYMSDANPLFVGGRLNRADPAACSPNHRRGAGQNVLLIDGSAAWFVTPNCGQNRDNIWQAGTLIDYQGTETQTSASDSFLIP